MKQERAKIICKEFFKVPLFDNGEHPFFGFCYGAGKPESFRAGDRQ